MKVVLDLCGWLKKAWNVLKWPLLVYGLWWFIMLHLILLPRVMEWAR